MQLCSPKNVRRKHLKQGALVCRERKRPGGRPGTKGKANEGTGTDMSLFELAEEAVRINKEALGPGVDLKRDYVLTPYRQ
jgi:hypothetical protein